MIAAFALIWPVLAFVGSPAYWGNAAGMVAATVLAFFGITVLSRHGLPVAIAGTIVLALLVHVAGVLPVIIGNEFLGHGFDQPIRAVLAGGFVSVVVTMILVTEQPIQFLIGVTGALAMLYLRSVSERST